MKRQLEQSTRRILFSSQFDQSFTLIGATVGLQNVWKFPFLCWKYGGYAFFIPYLLVMIFFGIPMCLIELSLGQFTGRGVCHSYEFSPIMSGIGIVQVILAAISSVTYSMIMAWAVFYLKSSLVGTSLPWASCNKTWNHKNLCFGTIKNVTNCSNATSHPSNGTCFGIPQDFEDQVVVYNMSAYKEAFKVIEFESGSQQFWLYNVLTPEPFAEVMRMESALYLFGVWIIVYFSMINGISTLGKMVYVTTTAQYVLLMAIFIKTMQLEGAANGISKFLSFKVPDRNTSYILLDAMEQMVESLSLGTGILVSIGSHGHFLHPVLPISLIVVFSNVLTSILAGFVTSSMMGVHDAHSMRRSSFERRFGVRLVFSAMPEVMTHMGKQSKIYSILFYSMIIMLGIDSIYASVAVVLDAGVANFDMCRKYSRLFLLFLCSSFFLCTLLLCSKIGIQLYEVLSGCRTIPLFFVTFLFYFSLSWIYGAGSFQLDIESMTRRRMGRVWPIYCKFLLSPFVIIMLLFELYWLKRSTDENNDYLLPKWAIVLIYILSVLLVLIVIVVAVLVVYQKLGVSIWDRFLRACKPTRYWGPLDVEERGLILHKPGFVVNPYGLGERFQSFFTERTSLHDDLAICVDSDSLSVSSHDQTLQTNSKSELSTGNQSSTSALHKRKLTILDDKSYPAEDTTSVAASVASMYSLAKLSQQFPPAQLSPSKQLKLPQQLSLSQKLSPSQQLSTSQQLSVSHLPPNSSSVESVSGSSDLVEHKKAKMPLLKQFRSTRFSSKSPAPHQLSVPSAASRRQLFSKLKMDSPEVLLNPRESSTNNNLNQELQKFEFNVERKNSNDTATERQDRRVTLKSVAETRNASVSKNRPSIGKSLKKRNSMRVNLMKARAEYQSPASTSRGLPNRSDEYSCNPMVNKGRSNVRRHSTMQTPESQFRNIRRSLSPLQDTKLEFDGAEENLETLNKSIEQLRRRLLGPLIPITSFSTRSAKRAGSYISDRNRIQDVINLESLLQTKDKYLKNKMNKESVSLEEIEKKKENLKQKGKTQKKSPEK